MITALGHNACENWEAWSPRAPASPASPLSIPSAYECQVAGEVKDFDPARYMDRKEARRADRTTQFAFVAADEALKQSGYDPRVNGNGDDMAVILGTAIGGITHPHRRIRHPPRKGPGPRQPLPHADDAVRHDERPAQHSSSVRRA